MKQQTKELKRREDLGFRSLEERLLTQGGGRRPGLSVFLLSQLRVVKVTQTLQLLLQQE